MGNYGDERDPGDDAEARTAGLLAGPGARARHAAEARAASPDKPSGFERSSEWALRFRWVASIDTGPDVGTSGAGGASRLGRFLGKAGRPNVGAMVGILEIMDRTTGATGVFNVGAGEIGVGLPIEGEWGTGWQTFRTEKPVSLSAFEDLVRFPNLLGLDGWETIQFTNVPIDHPSTWKEVWYGDGVDISDITSGLELSISYGVGFLKLYTLYWGDLDDEMVSAMGAENLTTALFSAMAEAIEEATTSQLPDEAGTTPHELAEFLDQQSLPEPGGEPVGALDHVFDEMDAGQSLLTDQQLEELEPIDSSPLPDDAGSTPEEIDEYLAQESLPDAGTDPVAALDHALAEMDAGQSLLTDHQVAEMDAGQSLMTDSQLAQLDAELAAGDVSWADGGGSDVATDGSPLQAPNSAPPPEATPSDTAPAGSEGAATETDASGPPAGDDQAAASASTSTTETTGDDEAPTSELEGGGESTAAPAEDLPDGDVCLPEEELPDANMSMVGEDGTDASSYESGGDMSVEQGVGP